MSKKFTTAEMKELGKNPNTLKVTEAHLSLTKAAKEEVLALIREGLSAYQIVRRLGYDDKMLGKSRCDGIRYLPFCFPSIFNNLEVFPVPESN